jgi:hypothetical protein
VHSLNHAHNEGILCTHVINVGWCFCWHCCCCLCCCFCCYCCCCLCTLSQCQHLESAAAPTAPDLSSLLKSATISMPSKLPTYGNSIAKCIVSWRNCDVENEAAASELCGCFHGLESLPRNLLPVCTHFSTFSASLFGLHNVDGMAQVVSGGGGCAMKKRRNLKRMQWVRV